jgi:hypothetical protein
MATKKPGRPRYKSVSITLEEDEVPKIEARVREQDMTVSQYFRRLARRDLDSNNGDGVSRAINKRAA